MKTRFMQSPCLFLCVPSSSNFEGVSQFQLSLRDNIVYTNFIKTDNQAEETLGIEHLGVNT